MSNYLATNPRTATITVNHIHNSLTTFEDEEEPVNTQSLYKIENVCIMWVHKNQPANIWKIKFKHKHYTGSKVATPNPNNYNFDK